MFIRNHLGVVARAAQAVPPWPLGHGAVLSRSCRSGVTRRDGMTADGSVVFHVRYRRSRSAVWTPVADDREWCAPMPDQWKRVGNAAVDLGRAVAGLRVPHWVRTTAALGASASPSAPGPSVAGRAGTT